jgi:predicted dehydrogenase
MTPVRIGIVGCGRIAQVMHLPFLDELEQFDLRALSDLSSDVLDGLARRYPRAATYRDYTELLAREDLDAVAICTPDHADLAEEAVSAGKHVFVEKPLCFTPDEGRRLVAAVEESGVQLMVGYMRRYDPAVRRLLDGLPELGPVRRVRALDTLGLRSVPNDVYALVLPAEGAAGRVSDRGAFAHKLAAAVGSDDPRRTNLYWIMLMLAVHDVAVLRAILGPPTEITHVELLGPSQLIVALRYADGARATLELGIWPEQTWSDTTVDVVGDAADASLSFPNPWVRYLPTALTLRHAGEDGTTVVETPPSYRYAFREEWLEFHAAISEGRAPLTGVDDGLADVELCAAVIGAITTEQVDKTTPIEAGGR